MVYLIVGVVLLPVVGSVHYLGCRQLRQRTSEARPFLLYAVSWELGVLLFIGAVVVGRLVVRILPPDPLWLALVLGPLFGTTIALQLEVRGILKARA